MPDTYLLGIDVSHHQNPKFMRYADIKAAGISWVMVRAAYGTKPDVTLLSHVTQASDAGLDVGVYTFYRQTQPWQAQFDVLRTAVDSVKDRLTLAPALDLEWNDEFDGPTKPDLFNTHGRDFCEKTRQTYGECVAYLAPGFFQQLGNPSWLLSYPWWVAHYTKQPLPWCPFKEWDMWQHGVGGVLGAQGEIDINRARKLHKLARAASVPPAPEKSCNISSAQAERKVLHATLAETLEKLRKLEG